MWFLGYLVAMFCWGVCAGIIQDALKVGHYQGFAILCVGIFVLSSLRVIAHAASVYAP